ncbi:hypothetical protein EVG20_g6447 [Dentipellis fragilis]|uniref:V-SNARE coiled-coil homology domain-containing protein n=1 Tax=Dentipellis fragilis TaxID=205917 RepID=A0A4Y9YKQ7_9AGAM|nr:hypothetical protein EVG20_g6447 [Dentipellis fragilis]
MDTSTAEATIQVPVVEAPASSDATSPPTETQREALQRFLQSLLAQKDAKPAAEAVTRERREEAPQGLQLRLNRTCVHCDIAKAHRQRLQEQLASVQGELSSLREQLTVGQGARDLRQELNAKVQAEADALRKASEAFGLKLSNLAKKHKAIKRRVTWLATSSKDYEATIGRYRVLNGLMAVLTMSGLLGYFGYSGALSTELCFCLPLAISACIAVASGTPAIEAKWQKAGSNQGDKSPLSPGARRSVLTYCTPTRDSWRNGCLLLGVCDCRSEPYDPYLPRGGSSSNPPGAAAPGASGGNAKTAAIQAQIDDTVNIMRDNITKVVERQERLDSLQDKTDNLAVSAQGFRRNANRVRKNMWWKDMKMRIIIGVAIAVIIVIIVVSVVKATHH